MKVIVCTLPMSSPFSCRACWPGEWLWVDSNGTDGKPTFHRRANLSWFSKICNQFREIAAWSRKSLMMITFFLEKRPLKGKFSKNYSERIHHVTEPRLVCKFREIWLTGNRQSRALFTWQKQEGQHPLTGQRAANFRLLASWPTSEPNAG